MEQALELFEKIGARAELGMTAASVARCYFARAGRLERSLGLADLARQIADSTGDLRVRSWLAMETEPLMYKGLWERTVQVARQHLPAAWEHREWLVVLWSSAWATIACLKLGDVHEARAIMEPAMGLAARRLDSDFCKIYPHIALSQLHLATGEAEAALQAAQSALKLAERVMAKLEIGAACRALGQAYDAKGDHPSADTQFCQSLAILGEIQSRPELAQSLLAYGRFKGAAQRGAGEALLRNALELFKGMDACGWVEETESALHNDI
jgi:tetratricopeptide (TPR) repeat protein